jgi:hypothetical protein
VRLDVHGRQGVDRGSLGAIEVPQRDQVIGKGSPPVAGPGLECGHELALVDDPVLRCEQSE